MTKTMDLGYRGEHLEDGELIHHYGPNVHILSDPYHLTLLAKLSALGTEQPDVNHLVTFLYRDLVATVIKKELPLSEVSIKTRMHEHSPLGIYHGMTVAADTQVVCVDIARAGMLPAQVCFDALNYALTPKGVRQDHLVMNRVTDESGKVVGTRLYGEKTGGNVEGRILMFPDPMGATGGSLRRAIQFYRQLSSGPPTKVITMNLIVTPEFIQNITQHEPDARIYAFRLDRGLSSPEVLESIPGTYPDKERGLNDQQYILPGAGGLGEVINNVYD